MEGVPVTNSGICEINGTEGKLNYRGYPISELAQKSSFIETAFLLIWGELPTKNELQKFEEDVQMHRRVSFRIRDMLKCFPESGHPMDLSLIHI